MKNLYILYFALIALLSCKKENSVKQPVVIFSYQDSLAGNGRDSLSFLVPAYTSKMTVINLYVSEQVDIQGSTTLLGRIDDTGFNGKVEKHTHEFPSPLSGLLMNRIHVFSDTVYSRPTDSTTLAYKSNSYWTGDGLLKIQDTAFLSVEYFK